MNTLKTLIDWTDNPTNIELTVSIPTYNARGIIWLALESLRYQINVNFEWELIIWEEYGISHDIINSFIGKLPNCKRILYKSLDKKISLTSKWVGMANDASSTSKIYVLQSADDYSSPKRLYIHYEHFKDKNCIISTQNRCLFYYIQAQKKVLYSGGFTNNNLSISPNMQINNAVLTNDMKKVTPNGKSVNVDAYICSSITKLNDKKRRKIYSDNSVDKNNWKYSLCTDGYNNISSRKGAYNKVRANKFYEFKRFSKEWGYGNMEDYIPKNVLNFLDNLKK